MPRSVDETRRVSRHRPGHTLVEVLISASLLLAILGLIVVPFLMINTASVVGAGRIGNQQSLRHPVSAMVRDLESGYAATIYAVDPSVNNSNGIAVYDTIDRQHRRIYYHLDNQRRLLREVFDVAAGSTPVVGSPFVAGRGVSYLFVQPRYENTAVPGAWLDYSLPVPDPASTTALPPRSCVSPPQRTLVMLHVIGFEVPDQPPLEMGTSFFLRN